MSNDRQPGQKLVVRSNGALSGWPGSASAHPALDSLLP